MNSVCICEEKQFLTRRKTGFAVNLPCYERQTVSIDSDNRCATSQANQINKLLRETTAVFDINDEIELYLFQPYLTFLEDKVNS